MMIFMTVTQLKEANKLILWCMGKSRKRTQSDEVKCLKVTLMLHQARKTSKYVTKKNSNEVEARQNELTEELREKHVTTCTYTCSIDYGQI